MAYKTIAVHLDDGKHCKSRVDVAADIARRFDAHLIGVYSAPAIMGAHALQDPWLGERLTARSDEAATRVEAVSSQFLTRAGGLDSTRVEFRSEDMGPVEAMKTHARYSDLIVIGQTDPDQRVAGIPANFPELVTLTAGRPVLVVPYYTDAFPKLGAKVLVAWNANREATRAVTDAMPFLQRAQRVTVMTVNSKHDRGENRDVPAAGIAHYLARHGVKAEAAQSYSDELTVGDELLVRVADGEIDLLVMGAYGHSRLREIVLGGVTQTLLQHMTVPILMSH